MRGETSAEQRGPASLSPLICVGGSGGRRWGGVRVRHRGSWAWWWWWLQSRTPLARSVVAAGVPGVVVVGLAPGAGDVAALGAAGAVADQEGLALGGVVEAAGAAEVEGEAVAAEDDGQDLRGARQAAGLGGGDAVAGEVVWSPGTRPAPRRSAVARSARSASRETVTMTRGGVAAVQGEPGGVEGLEELDERLAHPLRVRQPRHRVDRLERVALVPPVALRRARVGVGLEVGGEPGRGRVGEAGGDPGGAVAEAAHREPGLVCSAWASRSARRAASAASAISGATTSRIRRPIRPSSLGPNSSARSTRWASASATVVASTAAGQRVECAVGSPAPARATRSPSRIAAASTGRVAVQRVGEAQVRSRVGVRRAGVLRQPARGVPGGGVSGQVAGVGEDPQPQLGQLPLRTQPAPAAPPPSPPST